MQGKMTEEMIIFRQLLEKHGIEYEDQSEPESYIPIFGYLTAQEVMRYVLGEVVV